MSKAQQRRLLSDITLREVKYRNSGAIVASQRCGNLPLSGMHEEVHLRYKFILQGVVLGLWRRGNLFLST